jgi:oxygen-independent coproporphyrinogen-3 oxidase
MDVYYISSYNNNNNNNNNNNKYNFLDIKESNRSISELQKVILSTPNFCRDNRYSRHNTSYWKRHEYLGIGPSAHSFNGESRQFNVSNNPAYIKALKLGQVPADYEVLTPEEKVNDYIMTGLRTKWGCDLLEIEKMVGQKWLKFNEEVLRQNLSQDFLKLDNQLLMLTQKGKLFADRIASDLFLV